MIAQRVSADPLLAVLAGVGDPTGQNHKQERAKVEQQERYHKIGTPPEEIVLDLDATDDPLYGQQEGRFFHGYYGHYCYLPLYISCGGIYCVRGCAHLKSMPQPTAWRKSSGLIKQIRANWPAVRIILRADSGFCREALMHWCEDNRVDYVFGASAESTIT